MTNDHATPSQQRDLLASRMDGLLTVFYFEGVDAMVSAMSPAEALAQDLVQRTSEPVQFIEKCGTGRYVTQLFVPKDVKDEHKESVMAWQLAAQEAGALKSDGYSSKPFLEDSSRLFAAEQTPLLFNGDDLFYARLKQGLGSPLKVLLLDAPATASFATLSDRLVALHTAFGNKSKLDDLSGMSLYALFPSGIMEHMSAKARAGIGNAAPNANLMALNAFYNLRRSMPQRG